MKKVQENYVWKDKKRTLFGLPLSFTKYKLTDEKLLIETGVFSLTQEDIRLYRIMDVTVKCSFLDRLLNIGTIHCCSGDKSTPEFDIISVKNPLEVKELLSSKIEAERDRKKISGREVMGHDDDDDFDHDDYDNN